MQEMQEMTEYYWSNRFHTNPEYSNNEHLVFVYGTLKQGFHNQHLLTGAEFLMYSRTEPVFEMVSFGAFPAIIPNGQFHITGEVYKVSGKILWSMDILEGEGEFYDRKLINIESLDKPSWTYILPLDRMLDTEYLCPSLLTDTTTKIQSWIKTPR